MSLLFDVWLVGGLASGLLDEVLAGTDLSGDDFGMYSLLRRYGPVTPTQVHRWTGLRPTSISAHLKRLETRGHAVRSPNPADGRSHLVGLTGAGKEAHDRATELFHEAMHALRARFIPDTLRERLVLQHIDMVLRESAGLDERPYRVAPAEEARPKDHAGVPVLAYPGAPLTAFEEQQVRLYIDFLRSQEPNRASPA
ncbi:DNA-binding MarR family transcriptional regulator [Kribbella steppae]|uniref:DNA-binding MarR family transcriptional regulator n=1 Tax=Kribbella steppae TaxID=2512223 RepID=A0A4R2H0U5_9ACTN|nr:MarR family transcriptional regulator [Kribbella steppae]TCO18102.1 DNA-binding MarR family transcriptional regulator [Kribbella steppae]